MQLFFLIFLFLISCGDGNFDFRDQSQTVGNNSNNILIREPNEGVPSASDGIMSPIMTTGNPNCTNVMGVDGADGFLSKPNSDSDNNLVVLLPKEFQIKFRSVKAELLDGSFEEGRFTGFANGNRQHWRFIMSGEKYTGLYIAEGMNQNCLWQVDDASVRQD